MHSKQACSFGIGHGKNEEKKIQMTEPGLMLKSGQLNVKENIKDNAKKPLGKPPEINKDLETKAYGKDTIKIKKSFEQIKRFIKKENVNAAKQEYLKALELYKRLKIDKKEEIYKQLLKLYHTINELKDNK